VEVAEHNHFQTIYLTVFTKYRKNVGGLGFTSGVLHYGKARERYLQNKVPVPDQNDVSTHHLV